MVSTSKILTVSYGTFSCTLEGFDESFDTMKAIAEYFRDLAADDRYFGAEPPTPDAEMLARIAEKEIARRVEAREDAGKIVLRAEEPTSLPAAAAAVAEAPAVVQPQEETVEPQPETETVHTEEVAASVEAAMADAEDMADVEADADIQAFVEEAEDEIEEVRAEEEQAPVDLDEDEAPAEDNDAFAEYADVEDVAAEAADETAAAEDDDDDSVAARLRRIRSVVARGAGDLEPEGFSEDEHAQDFLADTVADLDAALLADDAEDVDLADVMDMAEAEADEDTLEEAPEQLSADDADLEEDDLEIESVAEDTLSQLLADTIPDDETDAADEYADAAEAEEYAEDEEEAADALADFADDLEDEADAATYADDRDETSEPLVLTQAQMADEPALDGEIEDDEEDQGETPLRARVIKMKRSDFEAAMANGQFEETFDELEEDEQEPEAENALQKQVDAALDPEGPRLTPEEEADLQSELDAVAAELRDAEIDELDAEEEQAEEPAPVRRKSLLLEEGDQDEDVSRLFEDAESHLTAPETNRRRSAIQHLRAAVEANAAEKDAGSALRKDADEDPYRSDIARVMRPTQADESEPEVEQEHAPAEMHEDDEPEAPRPARARRPIEARPAPLKLVAEQRIDTPRDPVRPRRVSAAKTEEPAEIAPGNDSFSEFAEDIGAANLSELLQAAAAYMADVEGRVQFSRPMLMGKLKEATEQEFSREDSLKSFGQLLRNGKLQKLKGGRFAITDETEFRPKKRDAG